MIHRNLAGIRLSMRTMRFSQTGIKCSLRVTDNPNALCTATGACAQASTRPTWPATRAWLWGPHVRLHGQRLCETRCSKPGGGGVGYTQAHPTTGPRKTSYRDKTTGLPRDHCRTAPRPAKPRARVPARSQLRPVRKRAESARENPAEVPQLQVKILASPGGAQCPVSELSLPPASPNCSLWAVCFPEVTPPPHPPRPTISHKSYSGGGLAHPPEAPS